MHFSSLPPMLPLMQSRDKQRARSQPEPLKYSFPLTIVMEHQGQHVPSRGRGCHKWVQVVSILLRHQRHSDGKWQRENEVLGSTFPKRAVIFPRLATVKVQRVLPWGLVAFLQLLKKSSSKDFRVSTAGTAQALGQNLADMEGQHSPLG